MNQKQLTTTPKLIELDCSGSIVDVEITSQSTLSVEWDNLEDGELEITESDEKTTIEPTFDQDALRIGLRLPEQTNIKIFCLEGSVNIDSAWSGDVLIECANEIEFESSQCQTVSVVCDTGSIDIGTARDIVIQTQDADINIGTVTENLSIDSGTSDIEVEEANQCSINTISGDVSLGLIEDASIQTLAGNITIEECHNASIESTSGDIEIGIMQGNLSIKSVSSEIEIGDLDTSNTVINDVSGSINIDMLRIVEGQIDIRSVSDDITAGIHSDTSAQFVLKSNTGEVTTPDGEESGMFVASTGNAMVKMTTISGSIEIG
ncbi:MAG: hypothetical protein KA140_06520 [Caldisericia bacterium]|nr:hypothetical protein [Caldisericia bacterium]